MIPEIAVNKDPDADFNAMLAEIVGSQSATKDSTQLDISTKETIQPDATASDDLEFDNILDEIIKNQSGYGEFLNRVDGSNNQESFTQNPNEIIKNPNPPGLDDWWARFQMARGGNFEEKRNAFTESFPEGDLAFKIFPDEEEPQLGFRKNDNTPWAKVDRNFFNSSGSEVVSDVVEFLGEDGLSMLGEMALTSAKSNPYGAGVSLIYSMARAAAGAFLGDQAGEGIQSLEGKQLEDFSTTAKRSGGKAVWSAGGDAAGTAVTGMRNAFRNRGNLETGKEALTPGAKEAKIVAKQLRLGEIPLHVTIDNPFVKLMGSQAAAILPNISRHVNEVRRNIELNVRKATSVGARDKALNNLKILDDTATRRLKTLAEKNLKIPKRDFREFSQSFKTAVNDWGVISGQRVKTLYDVARNIETPNFDFTPALDQVKRTKLQERQYSSELNKILDELSDVKNLSPRKTEPLSDGSVEELSTTDLLNGYITDLYKLSKPVLGSSPDITNKAAGELYRSLKTVRDNPANVSKEFTDAWGKARAEYKARRTTMDMGIYVEAMRTETPSKFIKRLLSSDDVEPLLELKKILPSENMQGLKDLALTEILEYGPNIGKKLDSLNLVGKELIGNHEKVIRNIGAAFQELDNIGIREVLIKEKNLVPAIDKLISNGSQAMDSLSKLIKANGGPRGEIGLSIRSAVLNSIYKKSVVGSGTNRFMDGKALRKTIETMANSGATKLLTLGDIKTLQHIASAENILRTAADAGTSMQANEVVSKARGLNIKALKTLFENYSVGKLITTGQLDKILSGAGRPAVSKSRGFQHISNILTKMGDTTSEDVDKVTAEVNKINEDLSPLFMR